MLLKVLKDILQHFQFVNWWIVEFVVSFFDVMNRLSFLIFYSVQYRLGSFGYLFMDDPEIPGNVGLLDVRKSLLWIQKNIQGNLKQFYFSHFSCKCLNPNIFIQFKNCSNLSLFKQIVLMMSKILQILSLQPRISKVFLDH